MKILHISDTHGLHRQLTNLPEADVIVHSGDFSMSGSEDEVVDFFQWFCDLPYKHKVVVAGNHDICLYKGEINGLPDDVHYLQESGIEIDGLKFWGVPLFMEYFVCNSYSAIIDGIPEDTDILVTHQPPFAILDNSGGENYGSVELKEKLKLVNPKLHLFGHDHNSNGIIKQGNTIYSNAAIVDEYYELRFAPRVVEVYIN